MKDEKLILLEMDFKTLDLINSSLREILGVQGIRNEDELKGFIKALQWVLS